MIDLEETFIFDAVVHAYNLEQSNYRNEQHAQGITEMIYGTVDTASPPGYRVTRDGYIRNWSVEETANMLFRESNTDMATFQSLPLYAYEDGLTANENCVEAVEDYPERFLGFANIDPLRDGWEQELEKQVEAVDPVGLKLYPSHWGEDFHTSWRMDDESVAYPVFEKAKSLGIDFIEVHKAIPFGPVPRQPYHPGDVDDACSNFPEIDFGIVHGGLAFTEETAWQMARFPNLHINMETLGIQAVANERAFAETMAKILSIGGEPVLDRMYWGSAAMAYHPQPELEAIRDFEWPDDIESRGIEFGSMPEITDEHKRDILGRTYADLVGLDIDEARERLSDDQFSKQTAESGLADPFSTTDAASEVY
ncbi:MAG: amidohydrolase family protein [Halopenitus sp.]